jgi:DNA-binding transcriptional ArsR family regulator
MLRRRIHGRKPNDWLFTARQGGRIYRDVVEHGSTDARPLIAEHPGCLTKELARLAGVAPASASEHATVLRKAGLIETVRGRRGVQHSLTGLGINLLNAT